MSDKTQSPIKSGWRGNINGCIEGTDSHICVSEVELRLDRKTAYALANVLHEEALTRSMSLDDDQREALANVGAALGRLVDNSAANNGGRSIIK